MTKRPLGKESVWGTNWKSRHRYNGSIELLRYLFTFIVAVMHFWFHNFNNAYILEGGYIAVDFFFMLSGLYLAQAMERRLDSPYRYTFYKWKKMFPIFGSSIICSILLAGFSSPLDIPKRFSVAIPDLLGIQMSGFYYPVYNTILWYVSAMLIAGFFIAAIFRANQRAFYQYIAPFCVLFGYCIVYHYNGNLDATGKDGALIIPLGVIRAFAGMSLGALLYMISKKIRNLLCLKDIRIRTLWSFIEVFSFALVLIGLVVEPHTKWDFHSLIGFSGLILCADLQCALWSGLAQKVGSGITVLGKQYTLVVYAYSSIIDTLLCRWVDVKEMGMIESAILYIVVLAVISVLISWVSDYFSLSIQRRKHVTEI